MEKIVTAVFIAAALMMIGGILGTLLGGFSGWLVGFFWEAPIMDFLRRFGVNTSGLSCWQIGVALGFMGGFFKTSVPSSSKS